MINTDGIDSRTIGIQRKLVNKMKISTDVSKGKNIMIIMIFIISVLHLNFERELLKKLIINNCNL